jgi:hypothetical protein
MPLSIARREELREGMLDLFADSFRLSKRGNPWREYEGQILSVFKRGTGYRWCIGWPYEGSREFSRRSYADPEQAIEALAVELGVIDEQ